MFEARDNSVAADIKKTESAWLFSREDPSRKKSKGKEVEFFWVQDEAKSIEGKKQSDEEETENFYNEEQEFEPFEEEYNFESVEEEVSDSVSSYETISSVNSKLSPFSITWSFGLKTSIKLINLTTTNRTEIFYVSSHFGVIFNYCHQKMQFLPGHNFPISSISADASGRWLVSADAGEDTVIIIWDNKKKLPAWSLYNVFPGGVKCVKISQDARFLAAFNCDFNYTLKFWRWTLGQEKPDGELEMDPEFGTGKHIDFNHKNTEQLAVTMQFRVVFCEWVKGENTLKSFIPTLNFSKQRIGGFRETIFLDDNHLALTSTNLGFVVVWCDTSYTQRIDEYVAGTIEKNFLKIVKIHSGVITGIQLYDSFLVSSSEDGILYFHDQRLRLMYILPKLKSDPIVSVSFNITNNRTNPFTMHFKEENPLPCDGEIEGEAERKISRNIHRDDDYLLSMGQLSIADRSHLFSDSKMSRKPSDCTIDMRPFEVKDFVFLTTTGRIGYLSHQRKKVKYFLYQTGTSVLAINCNPNKNHLIVSYSGEFLVLYNYATKKTLMSIQTTGIKITTLTYSHLGHILFAGTESAAILEYDPLLLKVKNSIGSGKAPIQKICLAPNDDLLAYFDQQSTVHVFAKNHHIGAKPKWISMGKYVSHYKPINDILFEENPEMGKRPRLFTIGEDRMLVEYDMNNLEPNKLKLLHVYRIEQTAIPCCFTWHPNFFKPNDFLISNSEYKLKVVDSKTHVCHKTTLGPTADTPIIQMKILQEEDKQSKTAKMIYCTEKHIGIKLLPSTGNPFEGMGMIGHPIKMISQAISQDCKYIFTAGVNDSSVLMWEVNQNSVEVASRIGGTGLEPFEALIEGGFNSFLFREIEDFFYYAQIIHQGEDPNLDRSVTQFLALCEIPDLFRSLGYYPTDYEVDNIIYELKHLNYHETGQTITEVSFEECVKAFLNHKPVHGIPIDHINKALMTIADLSDPTDILIERSELYKALEDRAEAMDHKEVLGYLCILLLPKDENNPVPATISLNDFASNVLGIDLTISEENVKQITHPFEEKKNNPN